MEFTFGIITSKETCTFLDAIIKSIVKQGIERYEIIIVGENDLNSAVPIKQIDFNESIKKDWITRKKNIICEEAKYENVVLMHDYVILEDGWYEGFKKYGLSIQFCINPIKKIDGSRFRDYVFFTCGLENLVGSHALVPYDVQIEFPLNKLLYVSGAYYVINKKLALEMPLCEELVWGKGEDLLLSKELGAIGVPIRCNPYSSVRLLKSKEPQHFENEMSREKCRELMTMNEDIINMYSRIHNEYLAHSITNMCEHHKMLLLR